MVKTFRYRGKFYTKEELLNILNEILLLTLNATKTETLNWINQFVPKRTGALRDSLIEWINKYWEKTENGIKISLGTDVSHAFDIIGDPQHYGTWFEHSGEPAYDYTGGRVYLDDPQALLTWDTAIASFIQETFNNNLISYKETLLGG